MSYAVNGTKITMTRGDTVRVHFRIYMDDEEYIPSDGDTVRFAVKHDWEQDEPCLLKEIPTDTMILTLDPDDTKGMRFGTYWYDVQITFESGDVVTFITKAKLKLTEEVE